jgi:hypothetical protein
MKRMLASLSVCLILGLAARGQTYEKDRPISKVPQRMVRFYPNPASEAIHFECRQNAQQPLQLRIFNFLGKKMVELGQVTNQTRIDLADFNRGLYLFQLVDAKGRILESGKFQVEK